MFSVSSLTPLFPLGSNTGPGSQSFINGSRRLNMIKKVVLGIAVGLILFVALIYFGGGRTVTHLGTKTEEMGRDVKAVGKVVRRIQGDIVKDIKEEYKKMQKRLDEVK